VITLAEAFQERLADVEAYLNFLSSVEEQARKGPPRLQGAAHPISVVQQKILYSSVYLQLYNLVEATMSRCIEAVTDAASKNSQWKPGDLSTPLRNEWVRVTARTHEDLNPEHRLASALKLCNHLVESLPIPSFEIDKGGGGNWDDKAIEKISARLGCHLEVSKPVHNDIKRPFRDQLGPLSLVKGLRNRLAHGAISFAQCAEEETVARLIELKDMTVKYLQEVVDCFTKYLKDFEYLLLEHRPA
jgi:MAE_28990/MAE_18760-like HEPN